MGKRRENMFIGIVRGTAVSDARYGAGAYGSHFSFSIEMEDRIEGIPLQIPVYCWPSKHFDIAICTKVNKDDKVLVHGKILKHRLKFWQKEVIFMTASHIYNETEDFGY